MAKANIEITPTSGDIIEKSVTFEPAGAPLSEVLRTARIGLSSKTRVHINKKIASTNTPVPDGALIKIVEPVGGS